MKRQAASSCPLEQPSKISRKEEEGRSGAEISQQGGKTETRNGLVPGQMYFTKVEILPDEFNTRACSLNELLEEIRPIASIHFNFMIDFDWLLRQYPVPCREGPITLVVGEKMGTSRSDLRRIQEIGDRENVSVAVARLPIPYGTHHTKLSILESEEHLHVIVSTANLVPGDWAHKSQCFYYTRAPLSTESLAQTSSAGLKEDLQKYLAQYKLDEVSYWLERLSTVTFPQNGDRLIYSFPGYHKEDVMNELGHMSVRKMLSKRPPPSNYKSRLFVAQCSSIGSLGPSLQTWIEPQFLKSLKGGRTDGNGRVFVIYPTVEDVRGSIEGYAAGCSLPYQSGTAERQPWMASIFCKWRSEKNGRSRAMPHCKIYSELLDGVTQWLLMTSANLSKAAWGELQKGCTQLMVRSYEMGVLISDPSRCVLPFDYPLVKYSSTDKPWICNKNYKEKDVHGTQWIVS